MTKQLRGEKLDKAIIENIRYMYEHTKSYIYNATKLSDFMGISRVTLNDRSDLIDEELKKIALERRTNNGGALVEQLQSKIERLETNNQELKKELDTLRKNHIEIYESLYLNSYDMSQLVKPIILSEVVNEKCPLCLAPIDISKKMKSNVVKLKPNNERNVHVQDRAALLVEEGIIFIGLQAAGKTSFYNKYFSSTHELLSLDVNETRKKEAQFLKSHITEKKAIVIDNTNPSMKERITYIKYLKTAKFRVKAYFFKSTLDECIERNSKRPKKKIVPKQAIIATSKKIQPPTFDEGFDEIYFVSIRENTFIVEDIKQSLNQ